MLYLKRVGDWGNSKPLCLSYLGSKNKYGLRVRFYNSYSGNISYILIRSNVVILVAVQYGAPASFLLDLFTFLKDEIGYYMSYH
jgi:hypothetical protein